MSATTTSSKLHVRSTTAADQATAARLCTINFAHIPFERLLGNTTDAAGQAAAALRHGEAWSIHREMTGEDVGVLCVHRTEDGTETPISYAEWFIYPQGRPEKSRGKDGTTIAPAPPGEARLHWPTWIPETNGQREKAQNIFQPVLTARSRWARGRRGFAVLLYVCTEPSWRRRGAATMCIRYGLKRCAELGIPAMLEASDEGRPVYERLGFEVMETVQMQLDDLHAEFPLMIWWPPGMTEEEKKPLQ